MKQSKILVKKPFIKQGLRIKEPGIKMIVGFESLSYDLDVDNIAKQLIKFIDDHNQENPNSMVRLTKKEIISLIFSGNAVILIDDENKLIGFIKLYSWGVNSKYENTIEVGSWIVNPLYKGKGFGIKLLQESIKLAKMKYLNSKIYAIVAKGEQSLSKAIFENKLGIFPKPGRPEPISKLITSEANHYDLTYII